MTRPGFNAGPYYTATIVLHDGTMGPVYEGGHISSCIKLKSKNLNYWSAYEPDHNNNYG